MLRDLTDKLNNANRAVQRVQRKHPGEEIVFASAATILETEKTAPPTGWSFRRLFQRRGVIVITRNRLFLRSNFVSAITALHVISIALLLVVRGMTAKGSLLTLYVKDKAVNVVPAQLLSDDIIRTISSAGGDTRSSRS